MPSEIVQQLTPEEEELHRKREELASIRGTLAERELELADLRTQLKGFEGRYLRQVGVLYAELDDWEAKVAELEASLKPSKAAQHRAEQARKRAQDIQTDQCRSGTNLPPGRVLQCQRELLHR